MSETKLKNESAKKAEDSKVDAKNKASADVKNPAPAQAENTAPKAPNPAAPPASPNAMLSTAPGGVSPIHEGGQPRADLAVGKGEPMPESGVRIPEFLRTNGVDQSHIKEAKRRNEEDKRRKEAEAEQERQSAPLSLSEIAQSLRDINARLDRLEGASNS